ncbi:MAG: PA14 domain-containing protein [Anaerolineae bacterium]
MYRRTIVLSLVLVMVLALALPVGAQGPITPQHSDPVWQASYWNNTSLSGSPVVTTTEANIDHDWGSNAPTSGVNADRFSARWTKYIDVTPGTYEFTVTSDDGIRIWVDNTLILDKWYVHPPESYTAEVYLAAGHHLIKVEYFEETGIAIAKVQWHLKGQAPPTPGDWNAEYFNNMTLSGNPALIRTEAAVNHDWGFGTPQSGTINPDHFSARWTRSVDLPAGHYTFHLTVDDGARLWVNGHLLVDAWYRQAATTYSGQLYLPGGPITIEIQYFEHDGLAVAKLAWDAGTTTPTPPPSGTVIVDDTDSGFVQGGAAAGWRTVAEGYNGRMIWTYNNRSVQPNYNWARWYPNLEAGWYEVFVYIPHRYTTTGQARYWVSHAGGYTLRIVNQSAYDGGQWVSLGTYQFAGTSNDYVSLSDVTYETYRSRLIGFDAVKWEKR